MRIAILASNYIRIPPEPGFVPKGSSGGPERIMSLITEELVKRGHEVTLFASGDSETSAKLVSVSEKSSSLDPLVGESHHTEFEHLLISKCFQMAKEGSFDVIHSLFDTRSAYYADLITTPIISTLHSPLRGVRKIILSKIPKSQYYVSISNNQRCELPILNYIATVYNGIDINMFNYGLGDGDYIMFAGRIAPEKGADQAITAARETKKKLYLLGFSPDNEKDYWNNLVTPYIDNVHILHVGYLKNNELQNYYQKAKAFLFPITWEEPFGLVMTEAMACGTPVIAYAKGSIPEIIKDGVTGFIVNYSEEDKRGEFIIKKTGIAGLKEAIERIYSMPANEYQHMREACHKHVEDHFTVEKMVDGYEKVYQEVISRRK